MVFLAIATLPYAAIIVIFILARVSVGAEWDGIGLSFSAKNSFGIIHPEPLGTDDS